MEELMSRSKRLQGSGSFPAIVTPAEAQRMVASLRPLTPQDVGSAPWLEQHFVLYKLNMQAHHDAQCNSDEFIKESLVVQDRVSLLVVDLLVIEAWKERAMPLLRRHLAEQVDAVLAYQLLHHEAVVANLLEVVMHHRDTAEALSEQAALELCDWCARKLSTLATASRQCHKRRGARELLAMSAVEELEEREEEVRTAAAMSAFTILRHLSDHMPHVSLGVTSRIAGTNDAVGAVLPLLKRPAWERQASGKGGGTERWEGGAWQQVEPADRHRMCTAEAQAWLLLYNVLLDPACSSKLEFSESRVEALLQLRPRLTPQVLVQLPLLHGLQRGLEELALGAHRSAWGAPGGKTQQATTRVVIEQAPALRAALLRDTNWPALAEQQKQAQFRPGAAQLGPQRLEALLQGFDFLSDLEAARNGEEDPAAMPPSATLVAYHAVGHQGCWEWHASYRLDLCHEQPAEAVHAPRDDEKCQHHQHGRQAASRSAAKDGAPGVVTGKRYRLVPLCGGSVKALPAKGRLVLTYGGCTCEALLELPAPETRDASLLPPALWVTVGALGTQGVALQLKVKRAGRAAERVGADAAWCVYAPAGGALSVRDGLLRGM